MFNWFRRRRRRQYLASPWPEAWSLHLNRNVRLTWYLDPEQARQLQDRVKVFLQETRFEGCEGLQLTDEMKVTVSAQACLMLLGVEDYYFDRVKTVLLFPSSFRRRSDHPQFASGPSHRSGEAWQGGPVVLSWRDALRGGRNQDDGQNVVIHEFAHVLDGIDGEMGGNLLFESAAAGERWLEVMNREFAQLVEARREHRRTLLDPYGATNRAEFFAVASESFFEQPAALQREHSELFGLLSEYYRLDPTPWQSARRN